MFTKKNNTLKWNQSERKFDDLDLEGNPLKISCVIFVYGFSSEQNHIF